MGRRASSHGVALGTVIAVAVLVLMVAALIASMAVMDLTLAQSWYDGSQAEMLARAAVTQFEYEQTQAISGSPAATPTPFDLKARYHNPVFPDGGTHLPGTVQITFDANQPYYSVDNSQSEFPAASCLDQGATKSVPPFSVDLLMTIQVAGRTSHFEAILQRRWPYAVASYYDAELQCLPSYSSGWTFAPSQVVGNVYVFSKMLPTTTAQNDFNLPVVVDDGTYQQVVRFGTIYAPAPLGIGGAAGGGSGNSLTGEADFEDPEGRTANVSVGNGNTWQGTARYQVQTAAEPTASEIFNLPDTTGYTVLDPQKLGLSQVSGSSIDLLSHMLYLGGPQSAVTGTRFKIPVSFGNHSVSAGSLCCCNPGTPNSGAPITTDAGLVLQDCTLFVDGDLDLEAGQNVAGNGTHIGIQGNNATLVVNGTLTLNGGQLSAQDQGMVIFCNRLVLLAQGDYKGLIVVRDSAVIAPGPGTSSAATGFSIEGGVVCGGRTMLLKDARTDPCSSKHAEQGFVGLTLLSTNVTYDPRYLKSIHQFGNYQQLLLRKLP